MNSHFEYLAVLCLSIFLPLLFTIFHPSVLLKKHYKTLILSLIVSGIPFIIWDFFATHFGHWSFNPDFILGIYIFNLPFEEVLFFFAIPFCCHFVWSIIRDFETWAIFWDKLLLKKQQSTDKFISKN